MQWNIHVEKAGLYFLSYPYRLSGNQPLSAVFQANQETSVALDIAVNNNNQQKPLQLQPVFLKSGDNTLRLNIQNMQSDSKAFHIGTPQTRSLASGLNHPNWLRLLLAENPFANGFHSENINTRGGIYDMTLTRNPSGTWNLSVLFQDGTSRYKRHSYSIELSEEKTLIGALWNKFYTLRLPDDGEIANIPVSERNRTINTALEQFRENFDLIRKIAIENNQDLSITIDLNRAVKSAEEEKNAQFTFSHFNSEKDRISFEHGKDISNYRLGHSADGNYVKVTVQNEENRAFSNLVRFEDVSLDQMHRSFQQRITNDSQDIPLVLNSRGVEEIAAFLRDGELSHNLNVEGQKLHLESLDIEPHHSDSDPMVLRFAFRKTDGTIFNRSVTISGNNQHDKAEIMEALSYRRDGFDENSVRLYSNIRLMPNGSVKGEVDLSDTTRYANTKLRPQEGITAFDPNLDKIIGIQNRPENQTLHIYETVYGTWVGYGSAQPNATHPQRGVWLKNVTYQTMRQYLPPSMQQIEMERNYDDINSFEDQRPLDIQIDRGSYVPNAFRLPTPLSDRNPLSAAQGWRSPDIQIDHGSSIPDGYRLLSPREGQEIPDEQENILGRQRYNMDYCIPDIRDIQPRHNGSENLQEDSYNLNVILITGKGEISAQNAKSLYQKYNGRAVLGFATKDPENPNNVINKFVRVNGDEIELVDTPPLPFAGSLRYIYVDHDPENIKAHLIAKYTQKIQERYGENNSSLDHVTFFSPNSTRHGRKFSIEMMKRESPIEVSAHRGDIRKSESGHTQYFLHGRWHSRETTNNGWKENIFAKYKSVFRWKLDDRRLVLKEYVGQEGSMVYTTPGDILALLLQSKLFESFKKDFLTSNKSFKDEIEKRGKTLEDVTDLRPVSDVNSGLSFDVTFSDQSTEKVTLPKEVGSPDVLHDTYKAFEDSTGISDKLMSGLSSSANIAGRLTGYIIVIRGFANMAEAFHKDDDIPEAMKSLAINSYFLAHMTGITEKLSGVLNMAIGNMIRTKALANVEVRTFDELLSKVFVRGAEALNIEIKGLEKASRFGEIVGKIPVIDIYFFSDAIAKDADALKDAHNHIEKSNAEIAIALDSIALGATLIGALTGALSIPVVGPIAAIIVTAALLGRFVSSDINKDMDYAIHHGGNRAEAFFSGFEEGIADFFQSMGPTAEFLQKKEREKFAVEYNEDMSNFNYENLLKLSGSNNNTNSVPDTINFSPVKDDKYTRASEMAGFYSVNLQTGELSVSTSIESLPVDGSRRWDAGFLPTGNPINERPSYSYPPERKIYLDHYYAYYTPLNRHSFNIENADKIKTIYLGNGTPLVAYARGTERSEYEKIGRGRYDQHKPPLRKYFTDEEVWGYGWYPIKPDDNSVTFTFNIIGNDLDNHFITPPISQFVPAGNYYMIRGLKGNDIVFPIAGHHHYDYDGGEGDDVLNFRNFFGSDDIEKMRKTREWGSDALRIDLQEIFYSDDGYTLPYYKGNVWNKNSATYAISTRTVIKARNVKYVTTTDRDDIVRGSQGNDNVYLLRGNDTIYLSRGEDVYIKSGDTTHTRIDGDSQYITFIGGGLVIRKDNNHVFSSDDLTYILLPYCAEEFSQDARIYGVNGNFAPGGKTVWSRSKYGWQSNPEIKKLLTLDRSIFAQNEEGLYAAQHVIFKTKDGLNFQFFIDDDGSKKSRIVGLTVDTYHEIHGSDVSLNDHLFSQTFIGRSLNQMPMSISALSKPKEGETLLLEGNAASNVLYINHAGTTIAQGRLGKDFYRINDPKNKNQGNNINNTTNVTLDERQERQTPNDKKYDNIVYINDTSISFNSTHSEDSGINYFNLRSNNIHLRVRYDELNQFVFSYLDGLKIEYKVDDPSDPTLPKIQTSSLDIALFFKNNAQSTIFDSRLYVDVPSFSYKPSGGEKKIFLSAPAKKQNLYILGCDSPVSTTDYRTIIHFRSNDGGISIAGNTGKVILKEIETENDEKTDQTATYNTLNPLLVFLSDLTFDELENARLLLNPDSETEKASIDFTSNEGIYNLSVPVKNQPLFISKDGLYIHFMQDSNTTRRAAISIDKVDLRYWSKYHYQPSTLELNLSLDPLFSDVITVTAGEWDRTNNYTPACTNITGNSQDNLIYGFKDLSNFISGGAGNDKLHGGRKVDYLDGGSGVNYLYGYTGGDYLRHRTDNDGYSISVYSGDHINQQGVIILFPIGQQNPRRFGYRADAQGDQLANIKAINASLYDDFIADETTKDDIILTSDGGDYLLSKGGNDFLMGGSDADHYAILLYGDTTSSNYTDKIVTISFKDSEGEATDTIQILDGSIDNLAITRIGNSIALTFYERSSNNYRTTSRTLSLDDILNPVEPIDKFRFIIKAGMGENEKNIEIAGETLVSLLATHEQESGESWIFFSYDQQTEQLNALQQPQEHQPQESQPQVNILQQSQSQHTTQSNVLHQTNPVIFTQNPVYDTHIEALIQDVKALNIRGYQDIDTWL